MALMDGSFVVNETSTVGAGVLGFGGLSGELKVLRWVQSHRTADLGWFDMSDDYVPLMFGLIIFEWLVSVLRGKKVYYLRQMFSNGSAGALMFVIFGFICRSLNVFPFLFVHHYFGLRIKNNWINNAIGFMWIDLAYYTSHYVEHKTNIGWAFHNMHHSSPTFNFGVAFRQAPAELCFAWMFYLPLALLVPPKVYYFHYGLTYMYQFFLHTQLIHRLPAWYELVFNTPSHHRVHHARNYPRANFGGILIVWDKLFGTFVPENDEKKPWYGLDERQVVLGTHNPVWQHLHHFWQTLVVMVKSKNKLKVVFTRYHGADMVAPAVTDNGSECKIPKDGVPADPRPLGWNDVYMIVHMLGICLPVNLYIKYAAFSIRPWITAVICANLVLSYISVGILYDEEKKQYAWKVEVCRLILIFLTTAALLTMKWAMLCGIGCLLSMAAVIRIHRPKSIKPVHDHKD